MAERKRHRSYYTENWGLRRLARPCNVAWLSTGEIATDFGQGERSLFLPTAWQFGWICQESIRHERSVPTP